MMRRPAAEAEAGELGFSAYGEIDGRCVNSDDATGKPPNSPEADIRRRKAQNFFPAGIDARPALVRQRLSRGTMPALKLTSQTARSIDDQRLDGNPKRPWQRLAPAIFPACCPPP